MYLEVDEAVSLAHANKMVHPGLGAPLKILLQLLRGSKISVEKTALNNSKSFLLFLSSKLIMYSTPLIRRFILA